MADRLIPPELRSGSIVDIGCGEYPYFLISTDFARKVGLDKIQATPSGQETLEGITIMSYHAEPAEPLPFEDDSVEIVTMLAVFEHIEPQRLAHLLREISRVLRSGGLFIMTTPASWTDRLLRLLAKLGLVSSEEVEDHKAAYTRSKVADILGDVFGSENIRTGYFEAFMNMWAVARKSTPHPSRYQTA